MSWALQRVQRGETYSGYTDLRVMACPVCGVTYAAPERLVDSGERDPDLYWYCPNGHHLHFPGKSEAQKLREARNELARERARHDQTVASLRATKGVVTRQRAKLERVSKGVCPCCNRSFTDLRKHMANKHPEYKGQSQ